MSSFEVTSRHDPATWLKIWDSRIVELNSKNRGAYGNSNCYYGLHNGDDVMLFFHRDGSGIYLATRFEGKISPEGTGSRIKGRFTRKKETVTFLWFGVAMMLLAGIVFVIQEQDILRSLLFFAFAAICFAVQKYVPKSDVEMVKKVLTEISEAEYYGDDQGDEFASFHDGGDVFAGSEDGDEFADFKDDGDVFAEDDHS